MRDLCNTDKPLFAVLTKLTYSAYLNILYVHYFIKIELHLCILLRKCLLKICD